MSRTVRCPVAECREADRTHFGQLAFDGYFACHSCETYLGGISFAAFLRNRRAELLVRIQEIDQLLASKELSG